MTETHQHPKDYVSNMTFLFHKKIHFGRRVTSFETELSAMHKYGKHRKLPLPKGLELS